MYSETFVLRLELLQVEHRCGGPNVFITVLSSAKRKEKKENEWRKLRGDLARPNYVPLPGGICVQGFCSMPIEANGADKCEKSHGTVPTGP